MTRTTQTIDAPCCMRSRAMSCPQLQRRERITAARRPTRAAVAALALAGLLGGCATINTLHADVAAFGTYPADQTGATFAFERLPSQQADPSRVERVEAAASLALQARGFKPASDAASARLIVEAGVGIRQSGTIVDDPWFRMAPYPYGPRVGWWGAWGPGWYGPGFGVMYTTPVVEYGAHLVLRDRASHRVLYEAHALHERVGSGVPPLPALFDAALQFFPNATAGKQVVRVPLTAPDTQAPSPNNPQPAR